MEKTTYIDAPADRVPKGWTKPPEIADLKADFLGTKGTHDTQVNKVMGYLENLNITGSAKPPKRTGHSTVQPMLIRKHAEWRYAALSEPFLATSDMFKLRPRTAADKRSAQQNEVLLNYQWNNIIDKVPFVDEMVRTGVDEGTTFIRVGWVSEEEETVEQKEVYDFFPATDQSQLEPLVQAAALKAQDVYAFEQHTPSHIKQALQLTEAQEQPIVPVLKEVVEVETLRIVRNEPTIEICNTANLHTDPLCNGDMDKAEFAIYSFETSRGELRREGDRYFNLDKIKSSSESILTQPDHTVTNEDSFNFKDDPRQKFVAYEYWGFHDVDGSGITTPFVATWVGDTLIRLEENPYPDGKIPFVAIPYLPVRKEMYGEPDGALLADNQKIVGAVTRGAIDLMARSANAQEGIRQDALDAVNKRKYKAGDPYEFSPMVDPRQAIIQHTYPEIPQSVGLMLGMQNNEAESITGIKPYSGGLSGSSLGETATAVRGVLDAATKRETGILRRFARGMGIVAKKIIAMNAEFLSDEEIIRVTDEQHVIIRREELAGSYDIEVEISTAEEDNTKAQELAFMLQTMGNNMDANMSKIILSDIARLRKMPQLAKRIDDFQPQPDPMAEKEQQLKLAKLELELAELQAKTQKLQTAAQLDMAKAGETMAKSGNIQSDTDQKNLTFLEQESGVQHQREIQQNQAQAEGNMALEILKSDLARRNTPQVS